MKLTKGLWISVIIIIIVGIGFVFMKFLNKEEPLTNLNPILEQSEGEYLQTTFSFEEIDGMSIPFQNGIPVPSFDPQERLTYSLEGEWKKERFEADGQFTMSPRDQNWLTAAEQQAAGRTESVYEDGGWETINLPFPENELIGIETAYSSETYESGVWYRRTFTMDNEWNGQAMTLKSLGLNYVGDFWVNGQWVGYHEGGYTPFAFDITPFVEVGKKNSIVIRVDNPPWGSREDIIPVLEGTDFFNYTGVLQDLYIEGSDPVHVVRADIIPENIDGTVQVKVVLENRSTKNSEVGLNGKIFLADKESESFLDSPLAASIKGEEVAFDGNLNELIEIEAGKTRAVSFSIVIQDPQLWSIFDPNLYVAEISIENKKEKELDRFATQFGIRTLGTESTKILMNEEPIFLAGIARHEEWPDSGRTATWDKIKADLVQIMDHNANMVRTGHYPNHVYTYILLDRLGLTTMSEIPLWQFEQNHFEIQAERKFADQMWREMIFSEYNRPSVIMWSTQNESKAPEIRKEFNERLVNDLHEHYDDGRLITQSAAADQPGANDVSMEPLDVAGWTMYFGVFHGGTPYEGTAQFLQEANQNWPDKPIINTEFGRWSGADDKDKYKQLKVYEDTMKAMLEHTAVTKEGAYNPNGYLAGIDFWIMYNWYVNHNMWIDTFGMYHMDRTQAKPVAELIQKDFEKLTQPYRE
ncbi:glycoside hydrolase family 2 protein [Chengkuizengella axinellae]|uniref:Glycoside hydrolase family 2 TIM barrel-domain containing protein n=1 Tax=Chengkuizengella axinellae TaxID=3064388 RepID=A0ABT9J0J0_9BACL|nr:glycoside hydrolase family 2 TIM barrel-domain containing protein [Chengkuizengella sp. 2205SS18-9]MDP5275136.1 glycoside hydrolase family 2 TIM barrel-domain containing protein [Chengkuizengella sp. 2205SS18-9]